MGIIVECGSADHDCIYLRQPHRFVVRYGIIPACSMILSPSAKINSILFEQNQEQRRREKEKRKQPGEQRSWVWRHREQGHHPSPASQMGFIAVCSRAGYVPSLMGLRLPHTDHQGKGNELAGRKGLGYSRHSHARFFESLRGSWAKCTERGEVGESNKRAAETVTWSRCSDTGSVTC